MSVRVIFKISDSTKLIITSIFPFGKNAKSSLTPPLHILLKQTQIYQVVHGCISYTSDNILIRICRSARQNRLAIQVSLQVLDCLDTRERETRAFVKLHNFIPDAKCLIITNSEEASIECDGIPISVLPAWKWLLETP